MVKRKRAQRGEGTRCIAVEWKERKGRLIRRPSPPLRRDESSKRTISSRRESRFSGKKTKGGVASLDVGRTSRNSAKGHYRR